MNSSFYYCLYCSFNTTNKSFLGFARSIIQKNKKIDVTKIPIWEKSIKLFLTNLFSSSTTSFLLRRSS